MKQEEVNHVTVLGTGNMGPGIAFQFARAGYEVILWGRNEKSVLKGKENLGKIMDEMQRHDIVTTKEAEITYSHLAITNDFSEAGKEADLIIEAIAEQLELKQDIFAKIEDICSSDTIIASNTSTLLPSSLSLRMKQRQRFLVTHFWNPAYLAPLVEVCGSSETSEQIINTAMGILRKIGNEPVLIRKEILGFLGNRIMHAMNREALSLIGNGVCNPEDIDRVILSSFGPRFANLGPMEYLDFSGLDLIKSIQNYLYADLDTTKGVLPVIDKLVSEGNTGMKTGKGLFDWSRKENKIRENRDKEFIRRLKNG